MSKFKFGIGALVASLIVAFGAFGLSANVPTAKADITGIWILDDVTTGADLVSAASGLTQIAVARASTAFTDGGSCASAPNRVTVGSSDTVIRSVSGVPTGAKNGVWICINLDNNQGNDGTNSADVTFDSNDVGAFREAICADQDGDANFFESGLGDSCRSTEGLNTDELIVDCSEQVGVPLCAFSGSDEALDPALDVDTVADTITVGGILVFWECPATGASTTITITTDDENTATEDTESFNVSCRAKAGGITLTAAPTTVEIIPAESNTSHSLIQLTVTDSAGTPILVLPSTDVDFTTDRCAIETSNVNTATELTAARAEVAALSTSLPSTFGLWDDDANEDSFASGDEIVMDSAPQADNTSVFDIDVIGLGLGNRSMAAAILHCDPHSGVTNATPGIATVQGCIEVPDAADICKTVQVTVIGPPASITVAASPTSLRCGEKATITVTVKDAIGQNVSDHTVVELVTNLGGTIGGTGGVAGGFGLVSPISSNGAATFGGVATAFLLTSESHSGPYEVVATTGGTAPFDSSRFTTLGGVFSTPPISAQVTVTCTIPAPAVAPAATITAPRAGTGITPPNTGDAGLASSSSSSWALFAIGGMAAFALAGLATLKFARR